MTTAYNKFVAYLYLENSDRLRFGSLILGLQSQFSLGSDQYPKTLEDAVAVLSAHKYDQGLL